MRKPPWGSSSFAHDTVWTDRRISVCGLKPRHLLCHAHLRPPVVHLTSGILSLQLRKPRGLSHPVVLIWGHDAELLMGVVNNNREANVKIEVKEPPAWVSVLAASCHRQEGLTFSTVTGATAPFSYSFFFVVGWLCSSYWSALFCSFRWSFFYLHLCNKWEHLFLALPDDVVL